MARYNPELMTVDGGGDTVFAPTTPKVDARIALRKLQSGQPLTDDEKRSLGLPVAAPTVTDTTVTDTSVADAAAKATADAAAAAAKAAADKAAADAAAAAAKTAAEIAAAKAAQLAAEKALADAKAAADKAAAEKALQAKATADAKAAEDRAKRQSAYDLLYDEFDRYGLGSLVTPLKDLITSGVSPSEFTIRLRGTDAYKKRFSANEARIKNGLRALSESEYIRNEDAYQEVMRRRGLPESYYARGDMGVQKGFEALLAGDVSSTELEDRIVTAQDRVLNANPEIARTLKEFYPGISNGDILAYSLDPVNAINAIKRKITAAEIGTAARQEGLTSGLSRAEELATMGITRDIAAQGYKTIGSGLQRGSQLAAIYGENPYSQVTAEQEIFNLQGAQEARKQRQKIAGLEKATFSGQTGVTSGALARDRAGAY